MSEYTKGPQGKGTWSMGPFFPTGNLLIDRLKGDYKLETIYQNYEGKEPLDPLAIALVIYGREKEEPSLFKEAVELIESSSLEDLKSAYAKLHSIVGEWKDYNSNEKYRHFQAKPLMELPRKLAALFDDPTVEATIITSIGDPDFERHYKEYVPAQHGA